MKDNITQLGQLIHSAQKILLINHVRMDMDAFGSLSAIFDICTQLGKQVHAVNDEMPLESFSFLGFNNIIETNFDIKGFNPDLIISFDAASLSQLGNTYSDNEYIFKNTEFVVIDHHKTNPGFGKINIINPSYSSTCELTFDIIHQLSLESYMTPKIATTLLSGIYTDTNIFYNSNTTPNTLYVSGKLMEYGANFRKPYFEFYKKKTYKASQLWGEVLAHHLKIVENGKVAYAKVTQELFQKTDTNERELTGLISEFFANIEGVEISFIIFPLPNGLYKVSFRSGEQYDVSEICSIFGGGGHKQAAGCSIEGPIETIEEKILNVIKKVI